MFIRFVSDPKDERAADELTIECKKYFIRRLKNGATQLNMNGGEEIFTLTAPSAGPWRQAYVMNNEFQTVERHHAPEDAPIDEVGD